MFSNRTVIEQLSEGFFEFFQDGSFKKMDPSRLDNAAEDPSLGKYSSALGIDPLLIQMNGKIVVVDPGLGWGLDSRSSYKDTSSVVTNLDIFEIAPEDVDFVILTHLHYDHIAGCTYVNDQFETTATFPNATYLFHKDEWDYALTQLNNRQPQRGAAYNLDEFFKLVAEKRVDIFDADTYSVLPGITAIKTGGHTPGHTIVKIQQKEIVSYFMGDLIPTEHHLNHYAMKLIDSDSVQAKKAKKSILNKASDEKATIFFYHSLFHKSGVIAQDKMKKFILLERKNR